MSEKSYYRIGMEMFGQGISSMWFGRIIPHTSEKMDQIDENLKARIRDIYAEEYEILQKIDILE